MKIGYESKIKCATGRLNTLTANIKWHDWKTKNNATFIKHIIFAGDFMNKSKPEFTD